MQAVGQRPAQSIDIASSSAHWFVSSGTPLGPSVTPSTMRATPLPNRLRISSAETSVSSTVSCSRPAIMQSVSMRSSARIVAVSIGCTMYGSPLFRCCPACAEEAKIRAFSSWGASWPRYWQVDQNASTDASEPATPPKRAYCDACSLGDAGWAARLGDARGRRREVGGQASKHPVRRRERRREREHRELCPPPSCTPRRRDLGQSS